MADINQYKRSKDRLTELLNHLILNGANDPQTIQYVKMLERSIETLELKQVESKTAPGKTGCNGR